MADIRDQTENQVVKAGGVAAVAADPALVVAISPNTAIILGADPDTVGTGTITAADAVVPAPAGAGALTNGASTAGSFISVLCPGGDAAWNIQVTGTFGGTAVYWEASLDSTNGADGNWINVNGRQTGVVNTVLAGNTTVAGFFRGNTSGVKYIRARAVGGAAISLAIVIRLSAGVGAIFLNASIPGGSNTIGTTNVGTTNGLALDATMTGGALVAQIRASNLVVSTTGLAGAAVTLTLPAVVGQFHYITRINILKYASVAVVGAAAPVVVTSTNLAGALGWSTPTAQAIGTQYETDVQPAGPIKSLTAGTATTIVCPATAGVIWRVNVYYYAAI